MALDMNYKNKYYLLGRYVAVVERSNSKPMTGVQMHNILQNTDYLDCYDEGKSYLSEIRYKIISMLPRDGFPSHARESANADVFWAGYYHQKAELDKRKRIEDVELHKGSYHQGDDLVYTADGEEVVVSGEFYVDGDNVLHHTHEFEDGTEIEIVIPYENGCYY